MPGLVAMFIVSRIDYHVWQKLSLPVIRSGSAFVRGGAFPGIGLQRFQPLVSYRRLSVQPSEIAKIAVIILLRPSVQNSEADRKAAKPDKSLLF